MTWQHIVIVMGAVLAAAGASACSDDKTSAAPGTEDADAATGAGREAATAEKGREAVVKRKCVECHGDNMAGAVSKLKNFNDPLELYPPNLTPDVETGLGDPTNPDLAKRGYTDDLLARAIRQGYDKNDQQLCPQMKHDANMSDFEAYSIVKYLRSIPAVKQKILRSVCPPLKSKEEQSR